MRYSLKKTRAHDVVGDEHARHDPEPQGSRRNTVATLAREIMPKSLLGIKFTKRGPEVHMFDVGSTCTKNSEKKLKAASRGAHV